VDVGGSKLNHIGIRVPDPYRLQVGCGDYDITDPERFAALASTDKQSYVRYFPDMPETFIELWHPDYDVAGYIPLN
jgi:hypothetical protein